MQYQFDVGLAKEYGVDEAVFVHNIYFWVLKNEANGRHLHDGKTWTYSSIEGLTKLFPFWTSRQIERVVRNCRDKGLIETAKLSDNPRDRTTWFTITQTVKCIYANGEMDITKRVDPFHQTVKCIKGTDSKPDSKPDRGDAPAKEAYGEFGNVKLTAEELDKLTARWTPNQVAQEIEALSAYQRSKGKRYADHYATLLNWLKRDYPPADDKPKRQEASKRWVK